ncbi:NAD(P)H-quinone oxidoreductase [Thalassospiraceae bacterium LMO-JJ14]|nr:NAD(P)H-quinone oxidoreductase [Thalassospiraceae bacterium LMO-JJ14]
MSIPTEMNCIEITEPGGPEVLKPATRPVPAPEAGEVLIRVQAAGVNRPDCIQREGNYAPPPGVTDIPGLEVAGEVVALGGGVTALNVGDSVCALVAGGGYGEYVTAPVQQVLPVPGGLSIVEAAALPETCMTVWTNVFERAHLSADDTLLVHGGSSGIGTTAIQIASALGSRVMVTAGSAEKCQACLDLGAERAVNYREEDFVAAAKEFGGKGVDVILDMVGGDYIAKNIKAAAPDARIVNIAFLRGAKAEVNFMPLMLKRLTLTGSTLRSQSIERKGEIARHLKKTVWPLIEAGRVKPVIFKVFPLSEARAAHELMESNAHIGKIMLKIAE